MLRGAVVASGEWVRSDDPQSRGRGRQRGARLDQWTDMRPGGSVRGEEPRLRGVGECPLGVRRDVSGHWDIRFFADSGVCCSEADVEFSGDRPGLPPPPRGTRRFGARPQAEGHP